MFVELWQSALANNGNYNLPIKLWQSIYTSTWIAVTAVCLHGRSL
jgi:hypothetical protein